MQIVAHTDIASASPTSPTLRNSVSVSLDISDYTAKEVNNCTSRYASYCVYYTNEMSALVSFGCKVFIQITLRSYSWQLTLQQTAELTVRVKSMPCVTLCTNY